MMMMMMMMEEMGRVSPGVFSKFVITAQEHAFAPLSLVPLSLATTSSCTTQTLCLDAE